MTQLGGSLWLLTTWRGKGWVMFRRKMRWLGWQPPGKSHDSIQKKNLQQTWLLTCFWSLIKGRQEEKLQCFPGVPVLLEGTDGKCNPLLGITGVTHTCTFLLEVANFAWLLQLRKPDFKKSSAGKVPIDSRKLRTTFFFGLSFVSLTNLKQAECLGVLIWDH